MKTVYLRDDDTSFFTDPAKLERIYGRLWEKHVPVNLAVVPAVRGDVRVRHREGAPLDPSIPPKYRGTQRNYPLKENAELCRFLSQMGQDQLVEVCLHGYDHSYYEFGLASADEAANKLEMGYSELADALPNVPVHTFIAPYDVISHDTCPEIVKRDFHIATNVKSASHIVGYAAPENSQHHIGEGQKLFVSDLYFFSHHRRPDTCLTLAQDCLEHSDFLMVTNHYWTFFYDWVGEWHEMLAVWDSFVDLLLSRSDVQFSTFSQVNDL